MAVGTAAATAAAAMVPRYSAHSIVSATGLLGPMLAVPVVLTTGGGIVLMRGPGVRQQLLCWLLESCHAAAAPPGCWLDGGSGWTADGTEKYLGGKYVCRY